MTRGYRGGRLPFMPSSPPRTFYEFFAGGGMARVGLGARWRCAFANDFDALKAEVYRANFGGDHFVEGDVGALDAAALPGAADLAWASFPCQDLSLAGSRGGLAAKRSSSFFGFWRLMEALIEERRAPRIIALENVSGLLTSSGGKDFVALCRHFAQAGYRFGALEIDAARFTPQSRPRVFVIAVRDDLPRPVSLEEEIGPIAIPSVFHTRSVRAAFSRLPPKLRSSWCWWRLPEPAARNMALCDIVEHRQTAVPWHRPAETKRLLSLMTERHREKVRDAEASGRSEVGAVYRRMRVEDGVRVQRAEVRFDGLAGCVRTPGGGSSKQFLLFVKRNDILSRPMTARESARLMGLPDDYVLPLRENAALKVTGDGVVAPVVAWLAEHVFEPQLAAADAGDLKRAG